MNSPSLRSSESVMPETASVLSASIEVTVKNALEFKNLGSLFPKGTHVYLPDIGIDTEADIAQAARCIVAAGYTLVAHIPVRRIPDQKSMQRRLQLLADEGVSECLVIAGEEKEAGEYTCSEDVLKSGLLDSIGYKKVAIAGHPEINTAYPKGSEMKVLLNKAELAQHSDAEYRIVTQFGFDAEQIHAWAESLRSNGIDLPLHLGIAGPTKLMTLIKFAARCGVGNSLQFLKKRASAITALTTTYSPEEMAAELEILNLKSPVAPVDKFHVFPFGGLSATSEWLYSRGSW